MADINICQSKGVQPHHDIASHPSLGAKMYESFDKSGYRPAPPSGEDPRSSLSPPPTQPSTIGLIIGQVTAIIAIAGATLYAAGGLSLGLKLWYNQFTWEPILGQLPENFVLVNSISVISPAIILGLLGYLMYQKLSDSRQHRLAGNLAPWLVTLISAAVLSTVPLLVLPIVRRHIIHGVTRPGWQIFVAAMFLNLIFVRLALYLLTKTNHKGLQEVLSVGILVFAVLPAVATVSATYDFPEVVLCGPTFHYQGEFGNYDIGNLIGTNEQYAYVAEAIEQTSKTGKRKFVGSSIAVIPLSSVQLEVLGSHATCGDLRPVTTPKA